MVLVAMEGLQNDNRERMPTMNADTCIAGLTGMAQIVTDIVIHKIFVDEATCSPGSTCTRRSHLRAPPPTGATSKAARSPGSG